MDPFFTPHVRPASVKQSCATKHALLTHPNSVRHNHLVKAHYSHPFKIFEVDSGCTGDHTWIQVYERASGFAG